MIFVSVVVNLVCRTSFFIFFFFNDTATTEINTLSLHDALPIYARHARSGVVSNEELESALIAEFGTTNRSEEHTSELQSRSVLVCRLLLEQRTPRHTTYTARLIPADLRQLLCRPPSS